MPFKKGHAKAGGRQKGTRNHDHRTVAERAAALGVDPFEIMLLFAKGDWKGLGYKKESTTRWTGNGIEYEEERIPPALRAKMAADVAQYIKPKLKAVEHSGEIKNTQQGTEAVNALTEELIRLMELK